MSNDNVGKSQILTKILSLKAKEASPPKEVSNAGDKLNEEIAAQGNKVRDLKSKKAEKAEIDAAVAALLDLKTKFKAATGQDWKPASGGSKEAKKNESKKGIEKCHENHK